MQSACRRRVLLMNMSVPEACDVDSREKWDVTPSNKYVLQHPPRWYSITQRQIYGFNFS